MGTACSSTIAVQVASFVAGSGRAESTVSTRSQASGSGSALSSCSTSAGSTVSISASRVSMRQRRSTSSPTRPRSAAIWSAVTAVWASARTATWRRTGFSASATQTSATCASRLSRTESGDQLPAASTANPSRGSITLSTRSPGRTAVTQWTKSAAASSPHTSMSHAVVTATARDTAVGSRAAESSMDATDAGSGRTEANVRSSSLTSTRSALARSGTAVVAPVVSSGTT